MKDVFAAIVWLSIGFGVQAAWTKNHDVEFPKETGALIFGAVFWPAFVAADVYREICPRNSSSSTSQKDANP